MWIEEKYFVHVSNKPAIFFNVNRIIQTIFLLLISSGAYAQVSANFTVSTPGDSCNSRTVSLDASVSTGNISGYAWEFKNKSTGQTIETGNGISISKNFIAPGIYSATLTVSGAGSSSVTRDISVYNSPEADFSADVMEGCPPLNVTFTNNSKAGDGFIIRSEWIFNDGNKNNNATIEAVNNNYRVSGFYSPTLIVTNSFGCKKSFTKDKYINIYNQTIPSYTVSNNTSCSYPNTVTFNNTTGNPNFNYTWDFGDGNTAASNAAFLTHQYTKPGNYKIVLNASNTTGACSGVAVGDTNKNVFVGKPLADFDIPFQICSGYEQEFKPVADPTGLSDAGKWFFEDDKSVADTTKTRHVFKVPGVWKIKFVSYNSISGCRSDTAIKSITVLPSPETDILADNESGCTAPHAVSALNNSKNAQSFIWNFGDGSAVLSKNNLSGVSHIYQSLGRYNMTLTATGENGCSSTDTVKIAVAIPEIVLKPSVKEGCVPLAMGVKALTRTADEIVSYTFNYGNGKVIQSDTDTSSSLYTSAGNFPLQVTATTRQGCNATSEPVYIFVDTYCNTDGDTTLTSKTRSRGAVRVKKIPDCKQKYTFEFKDTTINARIISWNMDGEILTSTSNPVKHTFQNPTDKKTFVVTVKLKDASNNDLEHGVRVVVVNEKASFVADKSEFCKNTDVFFRTIGIDSSHISKYYWDYGDYSKKDTIYNQVYYDTTGFYLNGNSTHTYRWRGNFRPVLTLVDKFGCRDSVKQVSEIKVKSPEAQFNIDKGRFCATEFTVNFTETDKTITKTPITEWKWSFGDNTTATYSAEVPVSHTYRNTNSYQNFQVRLTIIDSDGCVDTKDSNVTSYVPRVNFSTADTLRCNTFNIKFKNTSFARVADTNQYTWKYGNGITSAGFNGRTTYADTGKYTITLIVKDNGGCVDSANKPGYVKIVRPKASFKIGSDTAKCVGTYSLPFTSTSTYSNYYRWDFGDGEFAETDNAVANHFYKAAGDYNVKLLVKGLDGCIDSTSIVLPIKGSAEKLYIKDSVLCAGGNFTAVVHGQNIKGYFWDFGDGSSTSNLVEKDSVAHVYNKPGTYFPNVILLTPQGCQYTVRTISPVIVDSVYNPSVNLAGELKACRGQSVLFTANAVKPGLNTKYSFYTGSGQLLRSKDTLPVYLHDADQDEIIKAVIHSDYHCHMIDSAFSNEILLKVVPGLQADILPAGDTICESNGSIVLNAYNNEIKNINYEWSHNNMIFKKTSSPVMLTLDKPEESGNYKLKVYNESCKTDSAFYLIKIFDKPDLEMPSSADVEYLKGREFAIPLEIKSLSDITSIHWDNTENLFYYEDQSSEKLNLTNKVTVQNPVYISQNKDVSDNYTVTVTAGPEKFNCSTKASISIHNYIPDKIPNAFSPNGDGLNDTWVINGLAKYPYTKIVVLNRWGNIVYENKLGHTIPWDGSVNGRLLTQGTYYYVIEFNGSHDGSDYKTDGSVTIVY